uniref:Lectin/glucanase superfamily protein n=1 Tax=viral metagenome TaxID=1070528 RepID=A0A6C0DJL0_9ZZZZ
MNILIGIAIISVISFLIYFVLAYFMLPKPFQRISKEDTISLSKSVQVITNEELRGPWTSNSGSSLIFYINPTIKDRTAQSGNEYAKVIKIGSKQMFQILVAPDAGRGLSMAPARLEIYAKGYSEPEYAEIPNFPLQRWTSVVIVKSGRRFNIYLNGTLAVSHMCTAMPDFDDTQPLMIGDPRLGGNISLISIAPYAMKPYEVRELVKNTVDTSGKPYMPFTLMSMFQPFMPSLPNIGPWCPGGNCTNPKKAGPLEEWSSPYA